MLDNAFPCRIRFLIWGKTHAWLEEKTGRKAGWLSKYKADGASVPGGVMLQDISKATGVDAGWLLMGKTSVLQLAGEWSVFCATGGEVDAEMGRLAGHYFSSLYYQDNQAHGHAAAALLEIAKGGAGFSVSVRSDGRVSPQDIERLGNEYAAWLSGGGSPDPVLAEIKAAWDDVYQAWDSKTPWDSPATVPGVPMGWDREYSTFPVMGINRSVQGAAVLPKAWSPDGESAAMDLVDDAMGPALPKGSRVAYAKGGRVDTMVGDLVVIDVDGQLVCRRLMKNQVGQLFGAVDRADMMDAIVMIGDPGQVLGRVWCTLAKV